MTCGTCGSEKVQCVTCAGQQLARVKESHAREMAAADTRERLLLTRAQAAETKLAAARAAVVAADHDALCMALDFPRITTLAFVRRGPVPDPRRGAVECDVRGCPDHDKEGSES